MKPESSRFFSHTTPARWLGWCLVFAPCWLLLTGGDGWGFGVVAVAGSAAVAVWLGASVRLPGWRQLPGFMGFLLRAAIQGGWDVARRAWLPSLPISPGWVEYSLRTEDERVRVLLSAIIGILPGTLALRVDENRLVIHALDIHQDWRSTIVALESRLVYLLLGRAL
ncbi:Na+/H+ antiporter subunit E [Saccharospirillum sp.]|uniref:Na+/H+ antiporter subunit E n=1 Tax=Saccharospirillum sp. TaxID=2033801 RepID=UPI0034A0AD15